MPMVVGEGDRWWPSLMFVFRDAVLTWVADHVYLVCEPPGEPYYLGRIMEFLHVGGSNTGPVDALRINWYYRPKEIGKKVQDTRMVFATMHSDMTPLASLRGKCQIRHRAEITDMGEYKKTPDCFWYERLYERYIQKTYEVIPTSQIINVPEHVKKVLDERWKYILVEQGRGKELTSAVKTCKRCVGYCARYVWLFPSSLFFPRCLVWAGCCRWVAQSPGPGQAGRQAGRQSVSQSGKARQGKARQGSHGSQQLWVVGGGGGEMGVIPAGCDWSLGVLGAPEERGGGGWWWWR